MQYRTNSHFSGASSASYDVTSQTPWLYTIACVRDRLIYIGETFDRGGLVSRLSSHFGIHSSTLRRVANEYGAVRNLRSPFCVVAAQLPIDEPSIRFDCSSKGVRLLVESIVHDRLARFATQNDWTIISSTQSSMVRQSPDLVDASESISDCVQATLRFVEGLTPASPFHFVTLGWRLDDDLDYDIGRILNRIEVTLCRYVIDRLRAKFGSRWWVEGVPLRTRKGCAERHEEEARDIELPKEAYLMLIDLQSMIKANWKLFEKDMQGLSGKSGKDRSTAWIKELNDVRRYWAHPIKQIFTEPMSPDTERYIRNLLIQVRTLTGHSKETT